MVCYFGSGIDWIGAYWPAGFEDKAFFPKGKEKSMRHMVQVSHLPTLSAADAQRKGRACRGHLAS